MTSQERLEAAEQEIATIMLRYGVTLDVELSADSAQSQGGWYEFRFKPELKLKPLANWVNPEASEDDEHA